MMDDCADKSHGFGVILRQLYLLDGTAAAGEALAFHSRRGEHSGKDGGGKSKDDGHGSLKKSSMILWLLRSRFPLFIIHQLGESKFSISSTSH